MAVFIKLFVVAFVMFIMIDLVWLVFVARKFYQQQIGKIAQKRC